MCKNYTLNFEGVNYERDKRISKKIKKRRKK